MRFPSMIFLDEVPLATASLISWSGCAKALDGSIFWSFWPIVFVFAFTSAVWLILEPSICGSFIVGIRSIWSGLVVLLSVKSVMLGEGGKVLILVNNPSWISSVSGVSLRVSSVRAATSSKVSTLIVLLCLSIVLSYDSSRGSVS